MLERSPDLAAILGTAQLPALPQSAVRMLDWVREDEIDPVAFAAPIEADPGMTGQVLRFVNSSYFGFAREVSSVKLAIALVGARTIKNFALWSAVFSVIPNPKCGAFDLQTLWKDSLKRALFARGFAQLLKLKNAEESFAAALLQDMAIPLLARALPADYAIMLAETRATGRRLSEIERERFGWTHATAAATIAESWSLPGGLAEVVANHANTGLLFAAAPPAGVQRAVTLSALLPSARDEIWSDGAAFDAAYQALGPSGKPSAEDFLARIDAEYRDFAPALKIAGADRPLTRFHRQPAGALAN